jgi:hypothetical protein
MKRKEVAELDNDSLKELLDTSKEEVVYYKKTLNDIKKARQTQAEAQQSVQTKLLSLHSAIQNAKAELEFREKFGRASCDPEAKESAPTINSGAMDYIAHRMCNRKHAFLSAFGATEVAKRMSQETGEKIEAYRCPLCLHFHVGHSVKVSKG